MKQLLLASLIALILPSFVHAQDEKVILPAVDGQLYYEASDTASKMTKDEVFALARAWVTKSFKAGKYALDVEDKAGGKIVGKGSFAVYNKDGSNKREVKFTMDLTAADNNYKVVFKNIGAIQPAKSAAETDKEFDIMKEYAANQAAAKPNPSLADLLVKIDTTFKNLLESLRSDMNNSMADL